MDNKEANLILTTRLSESKKKLQNLKLEKEKIQIVREQTTKQLECEHIIEKLTDFDGYETTYMYSCKKCGFYHEI